MMAAANTMVANGHTKPLATMATAVATKPVASVVANVAKPVASVVANAAKPVAITVVANNEDELDDDDQLAGFNPPKSGARIEVRSRQRKAGRVYVLGWRWQIKKDGQPVRTATGGYKRGYKYVKTVANKRTANQIRSAANRATRRH